MFNQTINQLIRTENKLLKRVYTRRARCIETGVSLIYSMNNPVISVRDSRSLSYTYIKGRDKSGTHTKPNTGVHLVLPAWYTPVFDFFFKLIHLW